MTECNDGNLANDWLEIRANASCKDNGGYCSEYAKHLPYQILLTSLGIGSIILQIIGSWIYRKNLNKQGRLLRSWVRNSSGKLKKATLGLLPKILGFCYTRNEETEKDQKVQEQQQVVLFPTMKKLSKNSKLKSETSKQVKEFAAYNHFFSRLLLSSFTIELFSELMDITYVGPVKSIIVGLGDEENLINSRRLVRDHIFYTLFYVSIIVEFLAVFLEFSIENDYFSKLGWLIGQDTALKRQKTIEATKEAYDTVLKNISWLDSKHVISKHESKQITGSLSKVQHHYFQDEVLKNLLYYRYQIILFFPIPILNVLEVLYVERMDPSDELMENKLVLINNIISILSVVDILTRLFDLFCISLTDFITKVEEIVPLIGGFIMLEVLIVRFLINTKMLDTAPILEHIYGNLTADDSPSVRKLFFYAYHMMHTECEQINRHTSVQISLYIAMH